MLDPNIPDISGDEDIGDPSEPVPPSDPTNPPDPLPILPPMFPSVGVSDVVMGDPTDSQYGDVQWSSTSCAVVAAGGVIHAMTGIDYPESVLVEKATAHGLYDAGTIPENFGKLLGVYEIPYHVNESGGMQDIVKELAYGRKVLVAIDGHELWGKALGGWVGEVLDWIQENIWTGDNHAVWITSIDVNDADNITVTLNGSGQLDGVGKTYSLEEFVDAAEDSRFHYVATNEAAPGTFQGSDPDPDLASFPEIRDYYEIRYSGVLPPIDVEGTLAASESIGSEPEFDIEQMRIDFANTAFFVKQFYPLEKWLRDEGLVADRENMIREYASKKGMDVEQVQRLVERWGLDFVRRDYIMEHITPNFVKGLAVPHKTVGVSVPVRMSVKMVQELLTEYGPDYLYNLWILENFGNTDSVGDICTRLGEFDFETETHTGAGYKEVVSHVTSTGFPALGVVDIDELKFGADPLDYFLEKFKEVINLGDGNRVRNVILFIPAVIYGVVESVDAAFDIGGDSPDGLVRVEFRDDMVNVRWPNGAEESLSRDAFERAFEDSRFSYILLGI